MGKFDFEIPADFLRQLGKLADVDRIAPKMLDEAAPMLVRNVKGEMAGHKQTSDMVDSVKKTKVGKSKNGTHYTVVRPTGTGRNGVRNMEKLAWLEYGVKAKDGGWKNAPKPILTKAIKDSEAQVLRKMQEVFEREVSK